MIDIKILEDFMEYRCGVYYWLKTLYIKEPKSDILFEIAETSKQYDLDYVENEKEKEFLEFFSSIDKNDIEALEKEVRYEYARLFIGPKKLPAPPYESAYRTRHMVSEYTVKVKELYKNAGMKIETNDNIPEDFIGFELEFMYYLAHKSLMLIKENNLELLEKVLKYQEHFLTEHLSVWIGKFTEDIIKDTSLEYFKKLASFTNEFISEDLSSLEELNK